MFQPTCPHIVLRIELRYVWFDVNQWCAVENVHVLDVHHTTLNSVQSHN